ncbi:S26 family signal peptidase [Halorhabdus tiamatea]
MSPDSGVRKPTQTRSPSGDGGDRWKHVLQYAFDIVSSVVIVALIGALLFATSGVWPPLVAIESASMEPHIDTGDLVFVMDEQRFPGPGAIGESGVVPARVGEETGYRTFEGYGDVVIYEPDGNGEATPIIHRAMFWVADGENWYDRADSTGVGGADNCEELANCPAPNAGFITKGDNTVSNKRYDQAMGISEPVKPEWVIGTAEYGVPGLGQVRLLSGEVRSTNVTATNVTATNATDRDRLTAPTNSSDTAPATP